MRLLAKQEVQEYKSSRSEELVKREELIFQREKEIKKIQDNLLESIKNFNTECELKRAEIDRERLLVECFKAELQDKEKELNKMKQEFLNKLTKLKKYGLL